MVPLCLTRAEECPNLGVVAGRDLAICADVLVGSAPVRREGRSLGHMSCLSLLTGPSITEAAWL